MNRNTQRSVGWRASQGPWLLGLVLFSSLPFLLLAAVSVWRAERSEAERVRETRVALAHSAAQTADAFVAGNLATVRTVALAPALSDHSDIPRLTAFFEEMLQANPDWEGAGLSGVDGWNIASTNARPRTLNIADRAYFQQVLARNEAIVSPAVLNRRTGNPSVILAAPIKFTAGERGVLIVSLSSASLGRSLAAVSNQPGLRTLVTDSEGRIFVHPNPEVALALTPASERAEVRAALGGEVDSRQIRAGRAEEYLVAYAPAPRAGWAVLIEQPAALAFGEGQDERKAGLLLLAMAAVVTAGIGWFLSRRVTGLYQREAAARAHAEAALRARDEFLSTASHDLKTPLTTMRGLAQLLKRRAARLPESERPLVDGLASIETATGKMTAQINELLDEVRLQMDRGMILERRPTDLVAMARQVAADHQQATDQHRIKVEASDDLTGEWDAERIERVLQNLLVNAVKYSPDGGDVTISLSRLEDERGAWAIVSVRDHGIGIPPADLPHIFDRFHRAGNVVGRIAGTGIGLAGAQQIVQQHGGEITVESREGDGATFTVRLPLPAMQRAGTSSAA